MGIEADGHGIPVAAQLRAGESMWAIGEVIGVRLLTHVGKCRDNDNLAPAHYRNEPPD